MSPTLIWSKFLTCGPTGRVRTSPFGLLKVTVRFAASIASTEAVIDMTRAAAPLPGAVMTALSPLTEGFCWASAGAVQASAAAVARKRVRMGEFLVVKKRRRQH
jgi:hypothetical protein